MDKPEAGGCMGPEEFGRRGGRYTGVVTGPDEADEVC